MIELELTPFDDTVERKEQLILANGTNVTELDAINQGIYSRYFAKNNAGLMPLIGSGVTNNAVENTNFGQIEYFDGEPFYTEQDERADSVFIVSVGRINFPIRVDGDLDVKDSLIEPLSIRKEATMSHIESPYIARNFSAQLMDGNEDEWRYSSRIVHWECVNDEIDVFEDSTNIFLPNDVVYIDDNLPFTKEVFQALPGWISENQTNILPFVEESHNFHFGFDYLDNNLNIEKGYDKIPGDTEEMMPQCAQGASAGFVHVNSYQMTDSIVYSGYKNSASFDSRRDASRSSQFPLQRNVNIFDDGGGV